MLYTLLSLILSFLITYFAIPVIIVVAQQKMLFDIPDKKRKVHTAPIPSLGGLGIFAGFVIACLISIPFLSYAGMDKFSEFQYYIAAALVIFFLGLKDDILNITPLKKFIGQVLAAFLIIFLGNLKLEGMHGFFGMDNTFLGLGYNLIEPVRLVLTYFTVLVIINSFNLIDGVDGLAGSLGLLTTIALGSYFLYVGLFPYATLSFALAGSLIAFLRFNFQPARIFMGDTGSLLIGLVSAILIIKFINEASHSAVLNIQPSPAIAFSIIMIPLLDTLRVFSIRILHKRSPFSPDSNHVHHMLLKYDFSHRSITLLLVGVNVFFIALAYSIASLSKDINCTWIILLITSLFFAGTGFLHYHRPKKQVSLANQHNEKKEEVKGSSKFFYKEGPIMEEK